MRSCSIARLFERLRRANIIRAPRAAGAREACIASGRPPAGPPPRTMTTPRAREFDSGVRACESRCRTRASRPRTRPGVRRTPGITAAPAAPGAPITVMPGVGTTLPRARATAYRTPVITQIARCSERGQPRRSGRSGWLGMARDGSGWLGMARDGSGSVGWLGMARDGKSYM